MRRRVKVIAMAVALVLVAAVDWATYDSMLLPAAYAQEQTPGQKTRKTPAMRESVYKKLSEAQEASEAGRESEALAILEDLKRDKNLNSYELAQLYSFYGFVYFNRERYNDSIQAYETVLRQIDAERSGLVDQIQSEMRDKKSVEDALADANEQTKFHEKARDDSETEKAEMLREKDAVEAHLDDVENLLGKNQKSIQDTVAYIQAAAAEIARIQLEATRRINDRTRALMQAGAGQ